MPEENNKQLLARPIAAFNPAELLESGEREVDILKNGETLKEKKIIKYLPAWARILWFNTYCVEQGVIMGLTCKTIRDEGSEKIVKRAILTQVINPGTEHQIEFVVATGEASTYRDVSDYERVETCAKARCLGAAGFSLREEKCSQFDEGNIPVDGQLFNRQENVAVLVNSVKDKKNNKTPENPVVKNVFSENYDHSDKSMLLRCLNSFFPYSIYKGEKVANYITDAKFISMLKRMNNQNYGTQIIDNGLSVNEFLQFIVRFISNPKPEDKALLIECINEVKKGEEE